MINLIFKYTFLQNAILGAILASIITGIIGSIIVEKKLVMLSGGIAHISFGGLGLGYLINIEPIYSAFVFSIISSLGIVKLNASEKSYTDVIIGIFWSLGMALGILFIYLTPGYPPDVNSYLFGDILTISKIDLILISITTVITVLVLVLFYNYWIAYFFDEDFFYVLGFNKKIFDYLLFVLITIAIISLLKLVGIILVIALLTIPPSMAKLFSKSFNKIIILSTFFSLLFILSGLYLSYILNIPSGATIIVTSALIYFIALILKNAFKK
ncbi:MAG: iron chelate uptake ABC transporter family permease subunit [Bacillota bacterium]|nr:iron chelate uptake ABC transporter family permease subunit [Bacillota bacterium]